MGILRIFVFVLLAGQGMATRAGESKPFELGVIPYLPTTNLIAAYQPLRAYLEDTLQRPVTLSTAPDFVAFMERVRRRQYDGIVLGPGLGRYAQIEAGYRPLVVSRRNVKAIVLVGRDMPYASPKDLAGKRVAMLEPMTGLSQLADELFLRAGLSPARDLKIQIVKSPYNATQSLLHEEVDAAVVTINLLPQLAGDSMKRMRVLAESREIPGLMLMFLPSPGHPQPERLQEMLLRFQDTEAGRQFIEILAMEGFRRPTTREMKAMDVFLPKLKQQLNH